MVTATGKVVREVLKVFLDDVELPGERLQACDVNSGLCDQFMQELMDALPGAMEDVTEAHTDESGMMTYKGRRVEIPAHYWVEYRGKFYDSETPDGVSDWLKLPIMKRALKRQRVK